MSLNEAIIYAIAHPEHPEHTVAVCIALAFGLAFLVAFGLILWGTCRDKRSAVQRASDRRRSTYLARTDGTLYKHRAMTRDIRGV